MQTNPRPKYALVTGAGSGLGREYCLQLARRGYTVAVTDIDLAAAQGTLRELESVGGTGIAERLDVTDLSAWQVIVGRLRGDWSQLDILVNNAGICAAGQIGGARPEEFQAAMSVNFLGVLHGCHAIVPWLRESSSRGHVINIASIFGLVAPPALGAYNASKAAVVALSETLYGELRPAGIGVTVVAPGFFSSELVKRGRYETEAQRQMAQGYVDRAKITAAQVVEQSLRAAERGELYAVLGPRSRWLWRAKRWMPALFAKLVTWKYHRQLNKANRQN